MSVSTRDDVVEVPYAEMSPALRALITYEHNGALDVEVPQSLIDQVRRETPVVRWEMGVGFFAMDDIVAAGRNPLIVSTNPATGVPFGMGSREPLIPLHIDGDRHRRYRKLLDPLLAPKKVASLEADVRALADDLIDGFIGAGRVELFSAFCVPLPATIFLRLFGMPLEDMGFLVAMKDRILDNEGTTLEEHDAIGIEAGEGLRARLQMRLAERRRQATPGDDLIGQFMTFEIDGDRLSDDEVINIMQLFTIAGLDTVTSSLACIVAWFARHPEERRRVIADPARLSAAIEELMRFESPVPSGGGRWAAADTEVNGVPVKQGDLVYLCWASGNLDPSTFERPHQVDFDRPDNRHIAFAAGLHRCLGSHLARLELRAAIDQLHRRLTDYSIDPSSGDAVRWQFRGVRQANHLPLTFQAR
jgi:cytochrome P450